MIFIFNSPPGTGKDEGCLYLEKYGFNHIRFKDELFKETFKYFDVSEEWFMGPYDDRVVKETQKEPQLGDRTRREALIFISEVTIKPKFGNGFFGKKTAAIIDPALDYCISDGGFSEEMDEIINKVGVGNVRLIQLTRNGCNYSNDSRNYIRSELIDEYVINFKTDIKDFGKTQTILPIKSYLVHNNGSKGEFHNILETIHLKEQNDKEKHNI